MAAHLLARGGARYPFQGKSRDDENRQPETVKPVSVPVFQEHAEQGESDKGGESEAFSRIHV